MGIDIHQKATLLVIGNNDSWIVTVHDSIDKV